MLYALTFYQDKELFKDTTNDYNIGRKHRHKSLNRVLRMPMGIMISDEVYI